MSIRALSCCAFLLAGTGTWAAEEAATPEFACYSLDDLAAVSGAIGKAVINNLNVNESSSVMLGGLTELRFSYAVANRNESAVYASVDAIFRDSSERAVAVISASPSFGSVEAGKTAAVERGTIVNQGTLAKVRSVCTRMAGAVASR